MASTKEMTNDGFSADKIDEHVWLGDLDSSSNHCVLDQLNITHILTVLDFEPSIPRDDHRIRKFIHAEDLDEHNLLEEFDSAYEFINDAVSQQKNVLIHCHAGMSRSATIACAYLMKKYHLTFKDAMERLRSKRNCVYPNMGFERQLRSYEAQYLKPSNEKSLSIEYKCKLCRQVLFTDVDLVQHLIGKGRFDSQAKSSAYKAKQNAERKEEIVCEQELFTNQPEWLTDIFDRDTNNGEIDCPNSKCQSKVGRYSLIGEKCTCAKWVNPAFHFHWSKVDACRQEKNSEIERILHQRTSLVARSDE